MDSLCECVHTGELSRRDLIQVDLRNSLRMKNPVNGLVSKLLSRYIHLHNSHKKSYLKWQWNALEADYIATTGTEMKI